MFVGVVNMIRQYDNVLNEQIIRSIMEYFKCILIKDVWSSSSGWDQNLSLKSTNTITHQITDNILKKEIMKCVENKIDINFDHENLVFSPSIYVWSGGSYITWHLDDGYPYNGTIYLNEEWDSNDGGIFLYKENQTNEIKGIDPKYNSMVVNLATKKDLHNLHCVTCIVPGTIKKRITIQWRVSHKQKKSLNYT